MKTLQANFLDQLQQMGSKYYKVLPVDLDQISSKKVKCHQKKQKCWQKIDDTVKVYRIGGRFNFIKCDQMVIRYAEQRFRMPRKEMAGLGTQGQNFELQSVDPWIRQYISDMRNELKILSKLKHPGLI